MKKNDLTSFEVYLLMQYLFRVNFINIGVRMHLNKNIIIYYSDSMLSVISLQYICVDIIFPYDYQKYKL